MEYNVFSRDDIVRCSSITQARTRFVRDVIASAYTSAREDDEGIVPGTGIVEALLYTRAAVRYEWTEIIGSPASPGFFWAWPGTMYVVLTPEGSRYWISDHLIRAFCENVPEPRHITSKTAKNRRGN